MFKRLLGFILNPVATTKAELKRPENQSSFKSGMIWLAVAQIVVAVLLMGVALIVGIIGRQFSNPPMWFYAMSFFGPFQALLWGLQAWILTSLGFISFAYVLDFFMARLFGAPQGRQALAFNMLVKTLLPWQIFMIITILGWLVLIVAGFMAVMRVIALVYEEKDLVKRFAGLVVASVVCGILQVLVMMALVPVIALAYSFQMMHFSSTSSENNSQDVTGKVTETKILDEVAAYKAQRAAILAQYNIPDVDTQPKAVTRHTQRKHTVNSNRNQGQSSVPSVPASAMTENSIPMPTAVAPLATVEQQIVAEMTPTPGIDWKKNAVNTGAKIVEMSGGAERLLRLFQ